MIKPFVNPYHGVRRHAKEGKAPQPARLNADIPADVFMDIFRCRLGDGTIQTTINILISKLHYALQQRGITCVAQQAQFEYFVANLELRLPEDTPHDGTVTIRRSPTGVAATGNPSGNTPQGPVTDDRRRVKGVRKGTR